MKKFVILMLALMLALTSVSAMADGNTRETKLILELTESFEWSAPESLTISMVGDATGSSTTSANVSVTKMSHFATGKNVYISVTDKTCDLKNGTSIIAASFGWDVDVPTDDDVGKTATISAVGSAGFHITTYLFMIEDSYPAGSYEGSVTFTAEAR